MRGNQAATKMQVFDNLVSSSSGFDINAKAKNEVGLIACAHLEAYAGSQTGWLGQTRSELHVRRVPTDMWQ